MQVRCHPATGGCFGLLKIRTWKIRKGERKDDGIFFGNRVAKIGYLECKFVGLFDGSLPTFSSDM